MWAKLDCAVLSDSTLSEHNNGLEFKGLSSNGKVVLADAVIPWYWCLGNCSFS